MGDSGRACAEVQEQCQNRWDALCSNLVRVTPTSVSQNLSSTLDMMRAHQHYLFQSRSQAMRPHTTKCSKQNNNVSTTYQQVYLADECSASLKKSQLACTQLSGYLAIFISSCRQI